MKTLKTENDVKAAVKKWFDARGAWSYAPVQNGLGVHGIPDRIGCVPIVIIPDMVGWRIGLFVAVECKRPGRHVETDRGCSKHQMLTLQGIADASGYGVVIDGHEGIAALHDAIFQQELDFG